ncbi:MAG: type III pantothenate kinase [Odoribacter sp.]|nr:type III pantothenate kinase [Odoribacter sp.]
MNLVIDAGNTRFKYAFFQDNELLITGFGEEKLLQEIKSYKETQEVRFDILVCNSGKIDEEFRKIIQREATYYLEAGSHINLPIQIDYKTPQTLGFDRVAACVGAWSLFPANNLLVIDSGTAITYNYVNDKGCFLGGNISPGQEIRFKSLHLFTSKLPYLQARTDYGFCGKSTEEAIVNGVMNGITFEVNDYIEQFYKTFGEGKIVCTGGNSIYLQEKLEKGVYYDMYLGLRGLNQILEWNKNSAKN